MRSHGFSSMLGIGLESGRITAASLHRANGRLQVRRALEAALPLDLLTRDPERFGREIRSQLDSAGIGERRCVVCIPLEWAYTLRAEIPPLSEKDVESFLNVQAEREFPFAPEELTLAISRYRAPDGTGQATLVAVPSSRLSALRQALKAAKLRPVSITFGVTSLVEGDQGTEEGRLVLHVGDEGIDLAVTVGGAVLVLRTLDEAADVEQGEGLWDAVRVARQIRITLGQFSEDVREKIGKALIFGPEDRVKPLQEKLCSLLEPSGMTVEPGHTVREIQNEKSGGQHKSNPALLDATAGRLMGQSTEFEFLRVPSNRFRQLLGRVSSRSTLWLGGAAAAIILGLGAALLVQYGWLSHLQSEWAMIESKVAEMKDLQEKARRFRPWFDDTIPSLSVARALTETFPEEGTVWVKRLEIKDQSEVSCSGLARSNLEWLAMLDRLRGSQGVEDLQILQVRGADPLQFTLSLRWNAGYRDES